MTSLTENGDIILDSLPQPQRDWVMSQITGESLLTWWSTEDGYCSDCVSLCMLLDGAGLQGLDSGPH